MELFGNPDATQKRGFRAFHVYTMRQAIEEGFILDVLQNYTTKSTFFELIESEKAEEGKEFEKLKKPVFAISLFDDASVKAFSKELPKLLQK